jgi:hypothetical protein
MKALIDAKRCGSKPRLASTWMYFKETTTKKTTSERIQMILLAALSFLGMEASIMGFILWIG